MANDTITHTGFISKVENDKIIVNIIAMSACASCHAKGMCTVSDMEEKSIEITRKTGDNYKEGERVIVAMKKSMGTKALMIGYVIPFLLILFSLIILTIVGTSEGFAGLVSLALLFPYYFGVYLLRDKLKNTFTFSIQ